MKTILLKKKFNTNSVGNEETGYTVSGPNKTMINVTKEPRDTHRKTLKKEISEKFMEKLLDMVNQNYKIYSRNFKIPKIKNMRRHRNK
jgi:hypothetical protein